MTENDQGAVVLTDTEVEALARYLAGRLLGDVGDVILWEDVPNLSIHGFDAVYAELTRLGQDLARSADVGGVDARYVFEVVTR